MIKSRVYDLSDEAGQQSAIFTLHRCLSTILIMLAPICPFITEELWRNIYSSHSIHIEQISKIEKSGDQEFIKYTQSIMDFNSMVWNAKKETVSKESGKPLSLKDPIDLDIPVELELFKDDLQKMHNLKTST
jgi:valyl-tRNA synthetase